MNKTSWPIKSAFLIGLCCVMMVSTSRSASHAGQAGDERNKAKRIEKAARKMLRDIYNGSLKELENLVHSSTGTMSTDYRVSKKEFIKDLRDKQSHLVKSLRQELVPVDLKFCKDDGDTLASPFAFYRAYKDEYKLRVDLGKGDFHDVVFLGGQTLVGGNNKVKCRLMLLSAIFQEIEGKFYVYDFFYNF